jgi:hypothetical protein
MSSNPDGRASRSELNLADREARNVYFRYAMHVLLPMAISLGVHVALFGATGFVVFQAARGGGFADFEYEAGLVEQGDLAGSLSFDEPTTFDIPADEGFDLEDVSFSDLTPPADVPLGDDTGLDDMGGGEFGLGAGTGGGILGLGGGAGEAGSGGFGAGMGAGQRLGVGVWDLRVTANEIAYVVDFSGSIITVVDDLRRELKRSIGRLRAEQRFNVVIFFGEGNRTRTLSFAPELVAATSENKAAFIEWIDTKPPRGGTEPFDAMRRALAMRPDAVFFFSDGRFRPEVVERVTEINRERNTQIACLLFDELVFEDASGLPAGVDEQARLLQRLAEQNRGRASAPAFKIVTLQDL